MEEDRVRESRALFVRAPFLFVHLGEVKASGVFSNRKRSVFLCLNPMSTQSPSSRAAGRSRTHKLTVTAMLSAVAFLLMFIEFPIPALIPVLCQAGRLRPAGAVGRLFSRPGVRHRGNVPEKPAVCPAPRNVLRLCRRAVQFHYGQRLFLLRRVPLSAQQVPQGRSAWLRAWARR